MARLLFQSVEIANDRVVVAVAQPDFAPFFALLETDEVTGQPKVAPPDRLVSTLAGGSDGLRSRRCILPAGAIVIASAPERRSAGRSGRDSYQVPRTRKLSAEAVRTIVRSAGNRTLRDLATDFGVSHETIRAVLMAERVA